VQSGLETLPTIPLAHAPDGGWILLHFGCHRHDALAGGTGQENARPLCHALGRVAVAQEASQFNDIFAFQFERLWFAAAHGFAPEGADALRYHQPGEPATNSLQDLRYRPLGRRLIALPVAQIVWVR
jgi:hypothetical protein